MREKLSYREAARQFEINDHNRVRYWERIYLEEGPEGLYICKVLLFHPVDKKQHPALTHARVKAGCCFIGFLWSCMLNKGSIDAVFPLGEYRFHPPVGDTALLSHPIQGKVGHPAPAAGLVSLGRDIISQ